MIRTRLLTALATPLVLGASLGLSLPRAHAYHEQATRQVEGGSPTIAQKVLLYNRYIQQRGGAPDVAIVGSSRTMRVNPAYITKVSGRTAFGFGVSNGTTDEMLVAAMYMDQRYPAKFPHLVIGLDVESFDSRLVPYRVLDYRTRLTKTHVSHVCGAQPCAPHTVTVQPALAIARDAANRQTSYEWRNHVTDLGYSYNDVYDEMVRNGITTDELVRRRTAHRANPSSYRAGYFDRLYDYRKRTFERALAIANAHGDVPVVMMTPLHPYAVRVLGPLGWNARRLEVRAYLDSIRHKYQFRLLDLSYIHLFGGLQSDFYDEVHMKLPNTNRVVDRLHRFNAFERPGTLQ